VVNLFHKYFGRPRVSRNVEKASEEEMPSYSPEAEAELVETIRQQVRSILDELKGTHSEALWPEIEEHCREVEEKAIGQLRLTFWQKRTGEPF
jgi:hypothetical protein